MAVAKLALFHPDGRQVTIDPLPLLAIEAGFLACNSYERIPFVGLYWLITHRPDYEHQIISFYRNEDYELERYNSNTLASSDFRAKGGVTRSLRHMGAPSFVVDAVRRMVYDPHAHTPVTEDFQVTTVEAAEFLPMLESQCAHMGVSLIQPSPKELDAFATGCLGHRAASAIDLYEQCTRFALANKLDPVAVLAAAVADEESERVLYQLIKTLADLCM